MKVFGQLEKAQAENLASDPTGTGLVTGRLWFNTTSGKYKVYDGAVVREFADLDSAQTFSNKSLAGVIISDYMEFVQQGSTPATPAAGRHRVFFKNDGTMYTLDEGGNEVPVGSGGSGAGKSYFDPVDAEIDSTIGNWLTDDGVGGASAGLTLAVTAVGGELLAGNNSLKISKDAADRNGHFVKVNTLSIDPSDAGSKLSGSFQFRPLSGYASDDLIIELYDITNAEVMYAGQAADLVLPNQKGKVNFVVSTKDNTAQIQFRLKVNNTNTNAFAVVVDEFKLGPIGQVIVASDAYVGKISWSGSATVPPNHLYCNGQAVSRTEYAELFAAIGTAFGSGNGTTTFNVPDMRGEFPRGWDDGRGVDSGRSLGSSQGDATSLPNSAFTTDNQGSHRHDLESNSVGGFVSSQAIGTAVSNGTESDELNGNNNQTFPTNKISTQLAGGHTHTISGGDSETRPRNVAGAFYICYKAESNVVTAAEWDLKRPFALAYRSGGLGIVAGVTTLTMDSTEFDPYGLRGAGIQTFVIKEAGYYKISGQLAANCSDGTYFGALIDGSTVGDIVDTYVKIPNNNTSVQFSKDRIYLPAGEVVTFNANTDSSNPSLTTGVDNTFIYIEKLDDTKIYNVVRNDEIITAGFSEFQGVTNGSYENVPTNELPLTKGRWRIKGTGRYRNTNTVATMTSLLWELASADESGSDVTANPNIQVVAGYPTRILAGFSHGASSRITVEMDLPFGEVILDVLDDASVFLNVSAFTDSAATSRFSAEIFAERIR